MRLSLKLLLLSEILLLTAVICLVTPLWWAMREQVVENMQNELKAIASTAALQISGDDHDRIRSMADVEEPAFREIQSILRKVQLANNVRINHIYTFYRDGDTMRFGVMLNPDDELFVGSAYPIQDLMRPVLGEGTMEATRLYEDSYGEWISAYAPLKNTAGDVVGLLAVDKNSDEYFSRFSYYTLLTLALGLLVLAVTSIIGYWVLQRTVIAPVWAVRNGMLAIGRRDFAHRVELATNDELQELGQTLNDIAQQFNVARVIQQQFFPKELPESDRYRIAALSLPCDATGGDYYDVFPLSNGRIAVVVADVSGHGLGPSLLMASCRSALRGLSSSALSPGAVLERLNELLDDELTAGRFITIIYGVLEPDGQFTYSNFGHGPAMVRLGGDLRDLEPHRPPLGIIVDLDDEPLESSVQLAAGDRVFLASDGLPEALNPDGDLLGNDPVHSIVRETDASCHEVVERLIELQQRHSGGPSQTDDVTLLCVDRTEHGTACTSSPERS